LNFCVATTNQIIGSLQICGGFLLLAYYTQVLLGRFIHNRRLELAKLGPITQPHPPLNILHISLGVTIIAFAFFQVTPTYLYFSSNISANKHHYRSEVVWGGGRHLQVVVQSHPGPILFGGSGSLYVPRHSDPRNCQELILTHFTQLLPIAYFAGYAMLPRQLRQEREAIYAPIITEEQSQTDRLLAEEES